ncbi:endonuclease/exonuclease/phosphatase family protein [Natronospora cellulosivora (SeqCode)]
MKKTFLALFLISILLFSYYSYLSNNHSLIISNELSVLEREDKEMDFYELKVMNYNIRQGLGMDDKLDLDRIAKVIEDSNADIISLNEVDHRLPRSRFQNQIEYLAEKLDMNYVFGPNLKTRTGSYGNAILSKYPLKNVVNHSLPTREDIEARGVLEAEVTLSTGKDINIFSTHFTPSYIERPKQLAWTNDYLKSLENPYIFMGDLNMEFPVINNQESLMADFKTFPAIEPTHGIDHIFTNLSFDLVDKYVIDTPASDHLPVVAKFRANLNPDKIG